MKLLLTSNGVCNKSISNALRKLTGRKIRIAFIPTAANVEYDDKRWLINDLNNCGKLGQVDIVDISALPKSNWLPRLKRANVIFVGGGNTVYLMRKIVSSGLKKELPRLLKKRIYVGISAGSIVTAKSLRTSSEFFYPGSGKNSPQGLGFVDFHIRPHLNSKYFPKVRDRYLKKMAKHMTGHIYAIDDNSAVLVDGKKIKVVSEGNWKKYSGKQ